MLQKSLFRAVCLSGLLLFQSCDIVQDILPDNGEETQTFIIKQGQHESNNSVQPLAKSKMRFTVRFDESAKYRTVDPNNQEDINKLYGFSDCSKEHHEFSARFGWRWFNNELQIFAYCYKNGVQTNKFITAVNLNQEYTYEVEALDNNKYIFRLNNQTVEMDRGCSGITGKYKLFPYFGGDEVAPQQIKIVIKDLPTS